MDFHKFTKFLLEKLLCCQNWGGRGSSKVPFSNRAVALFSAESVPWFDTNKTF